MALMLRKAAQPVLNNADLDPYHADLDRNTKEFKLYTPCGKTFATVSGVLFGSIRPTKEEIDFAVELLEFWLLRNKAIIDEYIAAFGKLQTYSELPNKQNDFEIHYPMYHQTEFRVTVDHNGLSYLLNEDGNLVRVTFLQPIAVTQPIKLPATKIGEALAFLEKHVDKHNCQQIVENILAEMNTCNDI